MTGRPVATRQLPLAAVALVLFAACRQEETPEDKRIDGADAARGRAVVADVACGVCHRIPGVFGASGVVGPSLEDFGRRALIAGIVPNDPATLVRWVADAPSIAPETGMPSMPLTDDQARDVAAFLYTLR
jgi:mono/diheme cytochrome c family protein